jgi:3-isopropylmalate dehydrogenase
VSKRIAVIGGDGIGPEVIAEAVRVVRFLQNAWGFPVDLWPLDLGAERYLRDGTTLPDELKREIRESCAGVLLGAFGDARVPDFVHAREILLGMRTGFDLYANVRPVRALSDRLVPLRGRTAADVRFVVFRENTEGLYTGIGGQLRRGSPDEIAIEQDINTRKGVERILRAAFDAARVAERPRLHMADKSNALRHGHELWLRVFNELRDEYPHVVASHVYIDALCLGLVQDPGQYSVIVTNNLFGDIVTDLGAALQGGLGVSASMCVNPDDPARVKLFEPVHGSAPDIAGKGIANPMAALLCVSLLASELGFAQVGVELEAAVAAAVDANQCTPDLGGQLGTSAVTDAVLARLSRR